MDATNSRLPSLLGPRGPRMNHVNSLTLASSPCAITSLQRPPATPELRAGLPYMAPLAAAGGGGALAKRWTAGDSSGGSSERGGGGGGSIAKLPPIHNNNAATQQQRTNTAALPTSSVGTPPAMRPSLWERHFFMATSWLVHGGGRFLFTWHLPQPAAAARARPGLVYGSNGQQGRGLKQPAQW
ncbi:hypothetical protein PLESTF_000340300 [Pleodorina starrii]|nr:hypothetical protein PLESTF_000340300 [Pleodorina starrii]